MNVKIKAQERIQHREKRSKTQPCSCTEERVKERVAKNMMVRKCIEVFEWVKQSKSMKVLKCINK